MSKVFEILGRIYGGEASMKEVFWTIVATAGLAVLLYTLLIMAMP